MIRLALVEDDELYRSQLREYIDKYSAVSGEKFTVTEFSDGDEIALGYKAVYDIILMDIEMKFMDGMMAAEEIRKVDTEVIIIFITNSPQFAAVCHQGLCRRCAGLCAEAGQLLCVFAETWPRRGARGAPRTALFADQRPRHGT